MRRILYVSHAWDLGFEAKHKLAKAGFQVAIARNGYEAVRAFSGGDFDVVVVNRRLPHMPAREFVSFVKNHAPELPVIMVSNLMPAPERPEGLDAVISLFDAGELLLPVVEALVPKKRAEATEPADHLRPAA